MRPLTLALSLLLLTAAASAEPYRFEPPAPTSSSSVNLRVQSTWSDSCVPRDAHVTRDGNKVEVLWSVPRGVGCLTVISPWSDLVPLGMFAPGTYEVVLRVDTPVKGVITIATKTLIVSEGAPAFTITPPFASTRGDTNVTFVLTDTATCGVSVPMTLLIDGTIVPATQIAPCTLRASLPAHAAGPVDVLITRSDVAYAVRSTLRYLDPASAPDESLFERILIPVLYSGPGAFGSQWVTTGEVSNRSLEYVYWFYDVALPCAGCPYGLAPSLPLSLDVFGSRGSGVFLFVPRANADAVQVSALVRDVSREEVSWGAELPIARERDFQRPELAMPNVILDPRYRTMLRVYDLDGVAQTAGVTVYQNDKFLASQIVGLTAPCSATPCNSNEPAHAVVDVASLVPRGTTGPVTLLLYRQSPLQHIWGFVSITNNASQHVTVIRAQ